jgi:hypothetical protein
MQLYLEWLAQLNDGVVSPLTEEVKQQVFNGTLVKRQAAACVGGCKKVASSAACCTHFAANCCWL